MRKNLVFTLALLATLSSCTVSNSSNESLVSSVTTSKSDISSRAFTQTISSIEQEDGINMRLIINSKEIPVTWEDNSSTRAILESAKKEEIVVKMHKYGGFEQVGDLDKTYPSSDKQTTTSCGDIVLYNSSSIVVFYGSNSWAYTRLGKINLPDDEIVSLLSGDDVTLIIRAS